MTVPPRPPSPAPVGSKHAHTVAPPPAQPTAAPKEQVAKPATTPPQGEVENAEGKTPSSAINDPILRSNWDEEGMINSIMRGDHFLKNPSNYFNNMTYHWRFFCMPDVDILSEGDPCKNIHEFYERLDKYRQVIIAESGVTGYNITDVNIESVFGDVTARGSQPISFTMKILEPNGVSFMDALRTAAEAAGIHNFMDFYYYLELTFKGYDENGNPVTNPFANLPENEFQVPQNLPNGGRWIWGVTINNIDVNLGSGGGEYKLEMLPKDVNALDQEYANSVDTMLVSGDTVEEMFEDLQRALNRTWKLRLALEPGASDSYVTHEFKFHGIPGHGRPPSMSRNMVHVGIDEIVKESSNSEFSTTEALEEAARKEYDPQVLFANGIDAKDIGQMRLTPTDTDFSNLRSQQGFAFVNPTPASEQTEEQRERGEHPAPEGSTDKPTANIGRGTPISSIIEQIMSTCEPAQNLARGSSANPKTADDSASQINSRGFRECVTWHVIPEVRFNKKGEWKYDFFTNRYGRHIIWHVYPRIDQEPILSHRQIRDAFNGEIGRTVQRDTLSALAARGFLPKRYDYLFTGLNTEVLNFDLNFNFAWSVMLPRFQNFYHDQNLTHARVNPLHRAAEVDQNFDQERQRFNNDVADHNRRQHADDGEEALEEHTESHKTFDERRDVLNEIRVARDSAYADAIQQRRNAIEQLDNVDPTLRDRVLNGSAEQDYVRTFAERYIDNEREQGSRSTIPLIPFSFAAGDEAKQDVGLGGTGQWHNGRQLYGAVLNQVYGTTTGRFQQVELSIRGDPFWIGAGCFEKAIQHNNEAIVDRARQAYHFLGQNCFVFRFKYPTDTDASGNIKLRDNESVTGVYKVTRVRNTFANGVFSQTLDAVRMPLIDLFGSILGVESSPSEESPAPDEGDVGTRSVEETLELRREENERREAAAEIKRQEAIRNRQNERIRRQSNGMNSDISGPKI